MIRYLYCISIAISIWILPIFVHAYELKVSPDVSISENYISDSNIYIASLHTWFNTNYKKDIVSASINQTISGTLFGDITLLGKNISSTGDFFGDVRIIGDTVYVSGTTNSDLIIVARHIVIDSQAVIKGDTLLLGQTVDMNGKILGKTQITSHKINIKGNIVAETTLTGTKILFDAGSKIETVVSYFSPQKANINPSAEIKELQFNQIQSIKQNDVIKKIFFGFVSFWVLIKVIATLFMIFILTHLFRMFVQKITEIVQYKRIYVFLVGVLGIVIFPILILSLFASIILIPISIIVASIFTIMFVLLPAISAIVLATLYEVYVQKKNKSLAEFNISALMLFVLTGIGFVPYIGGMLVYLMYIYSFGIMTMYLYESVRKKGVKHLF